MITLENAKWLYKCGLHEALLMYNYKLKVNTINFIESGVRSEINKRKNIDTMTKIWNIMNGQY